MVAIQQYKPLQKLGWWVYPLIWKSWEMINPSIDRCHPAIQAPWALPPCHHHCRTCSRYHSTTACALQTNLLPDPTIDSTEFCCCCAITQSINQSLNQAQQKQKAPQNIMETHFLAQNTTNKNKASSTRIVASWALLACQVSTSHTILPLSTCSSSGSENLWKLRKSGQWHWALSPGFGAKRYLLSASTSYHFLSLITCVDFGDERHVLLVAFSCQSPTVRQNSVPSLWFWRRTPCIKLSERIHAELQNHVNSTWTLHSYPG